jgi:endogenous inhibitor of DNA gyrase (YacG/DUF329 family)
MKCPICRQPSQAKYQPFCSGYCADVDLLRWLNQDYRISSPLSSEESTAPNQDEAAEKE